MRWSEFLFVDFSLWDRDLRFEIRPWGLSLRCAEMVTLVAEWIEGKSQRVAQLVACVLTPLFYVARRGQFPAV